MQDKISIFNSLLDAYNNHLPNIGQLILDNFLFFNEPVELEVLINNDISRYSLTNNFMLPTNVFAIPDQTKEFDPIVSDYEAILIYEIFKDFSISAQIKIQVDRQERFVYIEQLLTGKINNGDWKPFIDDYKTLALSFMQIKNIRNRKGELLHEIN